MKKIDLQLAIATGETFVHDMCNQLNVLTVIYHKVYMGRHHKHQTIKTAMTLMLFNTLEGYSNFLVSLITSLANDQISNAPQIINQLREFELFTIQDKRLILDKYTVKEQSAFLRVMDKLALAPHYLSKMFFAEPYVVDKSHKHWESIKMLKDERDRLSHMKHDLSSINVDLSFPGYDPNPIDLPPGEREHVTDLYMQSLLWDQVPSNMNVNNNDDLCRYFEGVEWYLREQYSLLDKTFPHIRVSPLGLAFLGMMGQRLKEHVGDNLDEKQEN